MSARVSALGGYADRAADDADRLTSPAVARNRESILQVLRRVLPPDRHGSRGLVLEIASGTGEHAVFFSQALPDIAWQPSDDSEASLASIAAWAAVMETPNLRSAVRLDAASPEDWPVRSADAILAVNLIHIAPWHAAEGLFTGAAHILPAGGPLILYGPFREGGHHTAESNAAFDADLQARDPRWGVRDLEMVVALGARSGLAFAERVAMPANNLIVVFRAPGAG